MDVPGDLLDLILIVLVAAFRGRWLPPGLHHRQSSASSGSSAASRFGAVLRAADLPARWATSLPWQAFIAILVVFIAAVVGHGDHIRAGRRGSGSRVARPSGHGDRLTRRPRWVNVIAVLLVAWLIGSFVGLLAIPGDLRAGQQLDRPEGGRTSWFPAAPLTLPGLPRRCAASWRTGHFTQVFSALRRGGRAR